MNGAANIDNVLNVSDTLDDLKVCILLDISYYYARKFYVKENSTLLCLYSYILNKELRKASIASLPEEQNFQLVSQKKEAQEEPHDTGNNDDEIELTTPADETKYSVVKAEIIPAESRIGFVEENEAEHLSSESVSCDYKGEIDEECGIDAEDSKPSSASSVRLQALKGDLHVYKES